MPTDFGFWPAAVTFQIFGSSVGTMLKPFMISVISMILIASDCGTMSEMAMRIGPASCVL